MNRIYQGRVSAVEIENPDSSSAHTTPWLQAPAGEEFLWQHHAHFQDAINYYLVALLALAAPTNPILGDLRRRLAVEGDEFQIWSRFRRRGATRPGLRESVAPYLTPGNPAPTLDEAFAAVLAGSESDSSTRDAAVSALLEVCDGAGAIQQQGRAYWPKFCDPATRANFAGDPLMLRRERHQMLLPRLLHDPATRFDSPTLDEFDLYSIATPQLGSLTGKKARERLQQAVTLWRERCPEATTDLDRLSALIDELSPGFFLPAYVGSSAKGEVKARLFALLLFKHVERSPFTFDLLRRATPPPRKGSDESEVSAPAEAKTGATEGDPIRLSRGARGYVFRAFTSLPCWNPADTPEPQWKEFDIAAFKYALTALNQIEEKKKERDAQRKILDARLDFMRRGKPGKFTGATPDDEVPPILAGDPRIARLEALLASDTLRVTNAMTDGEAAPYGLHPRTVRGFRDLRKLWRRRAGPGVPPTPPLVEQLRADLREFQTAQRETIGSVALFDALLAPENWLIWQEPEPKTAAAWALAGYVTDPGDPLAALVDEYELKESVARLTEPIRLTPADPIHSRRQYDFKAVTGFKPRSPFRHEPGALAFTTEIARREGATWRIEHVRLHYSAPRLLRDGLRGEDATGDLTAARWLQPMMEAIAPAPKLPQDLTDCPVSLMPDLTVSGERRVLLNFPVTLDPAALLQQLGQTHDWAGQFCGPRDEPFALRWPADRKPNEDDAQAWYRRSAPFTVLGVDLGTRDAGALAHLTVSPHQPDKIHRFVGAVGGPRWWAMLTGTQMIRLPGEDVKVFTPGSAQPTTERYGERGRLASATETAEAEALVCALGEDAALLLGQADAPSRRFFPLQNDLLLVALRRAQARLARLHSLGWRVRDDAKRAEALADLALTHPGLVSLDPAAIAPAIDAVLLAQRDLVTRSLVAIANRVLPLRGRSWIWLANEREGRGFALRQTDPSSDAPVRKIAGQRGLSMERLEQIEELRRRCQSLNRALQHAPGQPARLGRATRGDELPDPCPALLEKIEHLREQRVDQTAHAILAAALGVRLRAPLKDRALRRARDTHGEYERFRAPVDFIVVENLSRYLSSQDRARRENSRLMQWSHRQLVAKLRQLCETYGLPVLATPAAYSSRFCSRTGAAGFRAVELSPAQRHEVPWRWHLDRLAAHERGEKILKSDALADARRVADLFATLDRLNAGRTGQPPRTLLAPIAGGPIFVPLGEAPAMQADLNAAINIALRGLAAPDCHDIHHRIRTERKKSTLILRQTSQREKARWGNPPPSLDFAGSTSVSERTPNLFFDVAQVGFADQRVVIGKLAETFATGAALWTAVKQQAWPRCAELNRARLARWERGQPVENHPEI